MDGLEEVKEKYMDKDRKDRRACPSCSSTRTRRMKIFPDRQPFFICMECEYMEDWTGAQLYTQGEVDSIIDHAIEDATGTTGLG